MVEVPLADSEPSAMLPVLVVLSVPPLSVTSTLPPLLIAPDRDEVPFRTSVPALPPKSTLPVRLALLARVRLDVPVPNATLPVRLDVPDRATLSLPAPRLRLPVMLPADTVMTSLPDPSRTSPTICGAVAVAEASACVRVTPLPLALRSIAVLVRPPVALIRPVLDRLDTVPDESRMAIAVPFALSSADAATAPLTLIAETDAPASITSPRALVPVLADPLAPTVPLTSTVSARAPEPSRRAVASLS